MKKSKTIFACAMLVTLASCSNDHVLSQQSPTPSDPDVINIVAASSKPVTRAVENATNLQNTQFFAGEIINVYLSEHDGGSNPVITYTQPLEYTVSSTSATSGGVQLDPPSGVKPKFPSNNHGVDAYALYPKIVKKTDSETFTVPTDQTTDAGYRLADMMFGTNSLDNSGSLISGFNGTQKGSEVELFFKHQLSKIIVKMDAESFTNGYLNDATIKIKGVKNKFTYKASDAGIENISLTSDGAVDIELGKYDAAGNACIIAPQDVAAETEFIEIKTTESPAKIYIYKIPTSSPKTFDGGKKYTYNIKLSGGSLVVVSTKIEEWGDGGAESGDADLQP